MLDDTLYDLRHHEGLPCDLIDALYLHAGQLLLQIVGKHAGIEFGHYDVLIPAYLVEGVSGRGLM